jgi:hypothetical protein
MKIRGIATREKQEKKKMGEIVFFFFPKGCKYKEQQKHMVLAVSVYIISHKERKNNGTNGYFFVV